MRKRSKYKKNEVIADYVFKRGDVSRFINYLMEDGRKSVAEKIFYSALENIKNITKANDMQASAIKVLKADKETLLDRVSILEKELKYLEEFKFSVEGNEATTWVWGGLP